MKLPHIAITSYLGSDESKRKQRLDVHLQQREQLKVLFPQLNIKSFCADYNESEKKCLEDLNYDAFHVSGRLKKPLWHNKILTSLYASKKLASVLILDDDTVPDTDEEKIKELTGWLIDASSSPGSCIYFSCRGMIYDVYTNNREGGVRPAPMQVVGWATFVRSDLGVLQEESIQEVDDLIFRCKCAVEGKPVLKHFSLFFKELGKKNNSSIVSSFEERLIKITEGKKWLANKYPDYFQFEQGTWNERVNKLLTEKSHTIKQLSALVGVDLEKVRQHVISLIQSGWVEKEYVFGGDPLIIDKGIKIDKKKLLHPILKYKKGDIRYAGVK